MRSLIAWSLVVLIGLGAGSPGLAAPPGAPSAATYEVGTSALCDFPSIEAAIAAASPGDTIRVQATTFNEPPLKIAQDLFLEGGYLGNDPVSCLQSTAPSYTAVRRTGTAIDRILAVKAGTATITGFIFENNANGGGVVVYGGATLDLEDAILQDNVADFGGGLHVVNATANLTNCILRQNRANLSGGGMDVWGPDQPATASLRDVVFQQNVADNNGGGLMLEGDATVTTHDSLEFDVNQAANDGGAIYMLSGTELTINANTLDDVYLIDNEADGHGGAIYVSGGTLVLNGALDADSGAEQIFLGTNAADADGDSSGDGGGIYAVGGATVQADETAIVDNSAEHGGGLFVSDSTFTGDDVYINYNVAGASGGGIAALSHSTVFLGSDSEVSDWNGTQPNSAPMGGGIYATGGSRVTLDASTVGGNQASIQGGGVYIAGTATFTATNSARIERNYTTVGGTDGGGMYATDAGTHVLIDASQVSTNTAIVRGGGLFVGSGAEATIQNTSSVWENKTLDFVEGGAGAYVSGADSVLTVSWSDFTSNYAATDGGGILNQGGTVHLVRAVLAENYAHERGGGLLNLAGTVQALETVFYKNESHNDDGGGLYAEGPDSTVDLDKTWFLANLAPAANGGGLATHRTELTVDRGYYLANSSDLEGSALYVTGAASPDEPEARIVNSFILDNMTTVAGITGPPGTGSSLYVEGTKATVIHNTFARQVVESFAIYVADGSNVILTNNIISNFVVGIRRPGSSTGTATAAYTLFHSNMYNYDLGVTSTDDIPNGDPAFVGGIDYHLTSASDAINAGTDAGLYVDWDGESRPWDGGFDIGADEFPDREFLFLPLIARNAP